MIDGGAESSANDQITVAGSRVDELMKDDPDASSGLSSRRGSVHDSADDESELSDIEEHEAENQIKAEQAAEEAKSSFPGPTAAGAVGSGERSHDIGSDIEIADSQDRIEVDE